MDDLCSAKKNAPGGPPGKILSRRVSDLPCRTVSPLRECGPPEQKRRPLLPADDSAAGKKPHPRARGSAFPEKVGGHSPMQAIPARGRPAPGRPWQGARHKAPDLTRGRRAFACKSPPFPEGGSRRRPQGYAKAEPGAGYRRFCLWPPCCRERRAGIRPRHGVSPADAEGRAMLTAAMPARGRPAPDRQKSRRDSFARRRL